MLDKNTFKELEISLGGAPRKEESKKKIRITLHLGLKEKELLDQLSDRLNLSRSAYVRLLINQQHTVQP